MPSEDICIVSEAQGYLAKDERYFDGVRRDFVEQLPPNPEAYIIEVGCGNGGTGALALREGKCRHYCGIEICEKAADQARKRLSEVILANIEAIELPWSKPSFDTLILSEVLEHLVDPWRVLRKLRPILRPGAIVLASSPNVGHYRVICMLVRGEWALSDRGPMDRTHLRWFTPLSFERMFENCGFKVDSVTPHVPLTFKSHLLCQCFGGWGWHLFARQMNLRGHCE